MNLTCINFATDIMVLSTLCFQLHPQHDLLLMYNDIAKYALASMGGLGPSIEETPSSMELSSGQPVSHTSRPPGFRGVIIGLGEQISSILLLSIFFQEVYATAFLPCVGKAVNFLLLSWVYAYYCFE